MNQRDVKIYRLEENAERMRSLLMEQEISYDLIQVGLKITLEQGPEMGWCIVRTFDGQPPQYYNRKGYFGPIKRVGRPRKKLLVCSRARSLSRKSCATPAPPAGLPAGASACNLVR